MTTFGLAVVGLLMLAGLCGVIVPVLPGLLLIAGAALWWAIGDGATAVHWLTFAVLMVIGLLGTWLKYAVPARRTSRAGASNVSLLFAVALGAAGMLVVPVIGGPIGFVLGIYTAERGRLKSHAPAWAATKAALSGFALSMLIEFTTAVLMVATWAVGVLLTR